MNELKMMFRLLRASAKSQVMYRADFVIGVIGTIAYNATFLASVGIITGRFGSFGGFTAWEIVLLYALFEMGHGFYGFFLMNMTSNLGTKVVDGTIDIYFLRPYEILIQLNGTKMNYTAFVDVFIGVVCFVSACMNLNVPWGFQWVLVPVFVVSGGFIEFALSLLMNCACIQFPNTKSLYGAYYQFVLMGQRYPLNIFAKGFQVILTFIFPLGFMNYYPMMCLTGRENGWIGYFSPLVALIFSWLAITAFHVTIRHYSSTGN